MENKYELEKIDYKNFFKRNIIWRLEDLRNQFNQYKSCFEQYQIDLVNDVIIVDGNIELNDFQEELRNWLISVTEVIEEASNVLEKLKDKLDDFLSEEN